MLDIDPNRVAVQPRDAATVLLLRDREGALEVFMVKRAAQSGFMGGAYVFPGGKLDAADHSAEMLAAARGIDLKKAEFLLHEPGIGERAVGLFVAAARETAEEAGVLISSDATASDAEQVRCALEEKKSFHAALAAANVVLSLDELVPLARWVTPVVESRRFDARFFLARFPSQQIASHDAYETTEAAWITPSEALARGERSEIQLPPPTLRTLEWLAGFTRVDAALAAAASRKPPRVCPVFKEIDGEHALLLPGHPFHPEKEPVIEGAPSFVLRDGRWQNGSLILEGHGAPPLGCADSPPAKRGM